MPDEMTIKTNNRPRDILRWHDLTEKERAEFDYLDTEEKQSDAIFVRYRGWTYDLGDFMTTSGMSEDSSLRKWHGYHSDSFYSGVLIKYVEGHERVILATIYT